MLTKITKIHIFQWQVTSAFILLDSSSIWHCTLHSFISQWSLGVHNFTLSSFFFSVYLFYFSLAHTTSSPCLLNTNIAQDFFYCPIALVYIFLRLFYNISHPTYVNGDDSQTNISNISPCSTTPPLYKFYRTIFHIYCAPWLVILLSWLLIHFYH